MKRLYNSISDNKYFLERAYELIKDNRFFDRTDDIDDEFSRHLYYYNLVLPSFRPDDIQTSISNTSILVVGCGGIGCLIAT